MLADEAVAMALVPWACPSEFGRGSRYSLEELVATGRRSFVYRARDLLMSSKGFDAVVAVKITPASAAASNDALSARRVTHPNVLQVLDRGTDESGATYSVTEWMAGGSLDSATVPWSPRKAAMFVAKLGRGVQAAHSAGVVHCDLKPANVLLTSTGEPKLADFDLAFAEGTSEDASQRGNLAFMSPEQYEGQPNALTPAADVYALGGMLYWLLTGTLPHGATHEEVVAFHRRGVLPPSPKTDSDLSAICLRALARNASDRHASASGFADDLEAWLGRMPIAWTKPSPARRLRLFAWRNPLGLGLAGAVLVALAAGTAFVYDRTVGARDRELENNRKVLLATEEKLADLQAGMRLVVRNAYSSMASTARADKPEKLIPALYWLDWFRGQAILFGTDGLPTSTEQIAALSDFVVEKQSKEEEGHVEAMVARFALVHYLIDSDRGGEAITHLDALDDVWGKALAPNDPLRSSLRALRVAAEVPKQLAKGMSTKACEARIQEELARLKAEGGSDSVARLLSRVAARLRPPVVRSPSVPQ
jgi:hypothetical protein